MAWPTSSVEAAYTPPQRTTLPDLRSRPVTELPGVGPRIQAALKELGVTSLADMISHYPSRHEDLSNVKKISDLRVGEKATIVARVVSTRPVGRPVRGRSPGFSAQLYDGTGYLPATIWGRGWLLNQLMPDIRVVVSGEVQRRYGIQLVAKSIEVIEDDLDGENGPHAGRFVPVYPVNKGIQARRMRTLIHRALDAAGHVLDPLPAEVLLRHNLPNLHDAVQEVHFPTDRARLTAATRRRRGWSGWSSPTCARTSRCAGSCRATWGAERRSSPWPRCSPRSRPEVRAPSWPQQRSSPSNTSSPSQALWPTFP